MLNSNLNQVQDQSVVKDIEGDKKNIYIGVKKLLRGNQAQAKAAITP